MSDTTERDIVVENDAVRAVFTNRGAVLKSWVLKRYRDHSGAPLDLVPQAVRGGPRPVHASGRRWEDLGDAAQRAL